MWFAPYPFSPYRVPVGLILPYAEPATWGPEHMQAAIIPPENAAAQGSSQGQRVNLMGMAG